MMSLVSRCLYGKYCAFFQLRSVLLMIVAYKAMNKNFTEWLQSSIEYSISPTNTLIYRLSGGIITSADLFESYLTSVHLNTLPSLSLGLSTCSSCYLLFEAALSFESWLKQIVCVMAGASFGWVCIISRLLTVNHRTHTGFFCVEWKSWCYWFVT